MLRAITRNIMSQSPAPASRCLNWRNQGLSAAEKQAILDVHNAERRRVAAGKESRGNPGPQRAAVKMPDLVRYNVRGNRVQYANLCLFDILTYISSDLG